MKIKALVIAPYQGLVELTTSLKSELQDFDIHVIQSDLSEVLPLIGQMEKEGYDLIISRGGTAKLLRHHSTLPVIEIQVSGYDILRTLVLVKDSKVKMQVIGFQNIIDGFVSVSSIMNIDIPATVITQESEVDGALASAREQGVKVVLGDTVTAGKAAEYGIQGVLITSGKESVLEAFAQAKHIHHIAQSYYAINETYENLMNFLDVGISVIDKNGVPQFANRAFRKLLKLPIELKDRTLFDGFPFLKHMIEDLDRGIVYDHRVMLMDPGKTFVIEGGKIDYKHNQEHYYIKVSEAQETAGEGEIVVIYREDLMDSFPPLLVEGTDAGAQTVNPEQAHFEFPLALYGEKGSGKRLFAEAIRRRNDENLVELHIAKVTDLSFETLCGILQNLAEDTIAYIQGINQAGISFQRALVKMLPKLSVKAVFAFEDEPQALAGAGVLEPHLYDTFKPQTIFIPPLRAKLHDLEGMIRSFIIQYNERLGKQIVGIRPEVLAALHRHDWTGNLIELQEIIKQFMMHTNGEYISEDVLPLLTEKRVLQNGKTADKGANPINLHQTLDEIERDIIMAVLEQEQMNQTRAAKRLGINRSTLWRKIKQIEE